MNIFRGSDTPLRLADANSFVGVVRTKLLASSDEGVPVHVYRVEFDDGGRTNWHTHSGPQWLFIVEGRVRVQKWGEAPQEVEGGDAVVIAPDEKHWHGAAPGARGVHLAVNVNVKTDWLEPVTAEQYSAPIGISRPR
jgi:quercetin dioxygenase-like cupin family protein